MMLMLEPRILATGRDAHILVYLKGRSLGRDELGLRRYLTILVTVKVWALKYEVPKVDI